MVAGQHDGGFWPEGDLGYTGANSGVALNGVEDSVGSPYHPAGRSDDAVALPHFQSTIPTYDDVDPLPPPTHPHPHHRNHHATNSNQGWLAPPLSSRDMRDDDDDFVFNNGAASSSREGSSVRGVAANGGHRGGEGSSRATSLRDSAGSRNGSRGSIFARKLACRQS